MSKKKQNYSRRKFIEKVGLSAAAVPLINLYGNNTTVLSSEILTDSKQQIELIEGADKPNIIFILSDDHRYDFMTFKGGPDFLKTPGFNEMAKEGAEMVKEGAKEGAEMVKKKME